MDGSTVGTQSRAVGSARGTLAAWWGVAGFALLLVVSVYRLATLAAASFEMPWHLGHQVLFVVNLAVMLWLEGYKGFQQRFAPRFAQRAVDLANRCSVGEALAAPLVLMGMLYAPRRQLVASWLLTVGIVAVVLVYRGLPQPWRGILDAGVAAALLVGLIVTVVMTVRALGARAVALPTAQ
ncbi:MAG: hypothetical protein AAGD86_00280 [Pseudomonadota bacterium]